MGLKSGSRSPGFNDDEEEEENEEQTGDSTPEENHPEVRGKQPDVTRERDVGGTDQQSAEQSSDSDSPGSRPSVNSIPYKLRRKKVNEGREQVPFFLRDEIIKNEVELQTALEEMLDEKVYKSDYREAAMVVAQRNPELVAEVLREWGYDLP